MGTAPFLPHLPVRGPVWLVACGPTSPATANENSEKLVWAGPGPFSKNLNWDGEILASDWDNLLKWEDLNTCKLSKATFHPADSWRGWSAWKEKKQQRYRTRSTDDSWRETALALDGPHFLIPVPLRPWVPNITNFFLNLLGLDLVSFLQPEFSLIQRTTLQREYCKEKMIWPYVKMRFYKETKKRKNK